ncbi:MBL fold metallo-hydrolase [Candidatus Woesearchaeota archaeon]|jgi:ribonuclease J|nr:MBL fold metallo-hydrolase [Candidatus Woesearchaeota archaeon]MBT5396831.1 MBL fold metallo-hydrolase [Candidatus Woesearchaeota archaeon]MBT5924843.1 MBL fold metallo-hydrolase [Candidatus Woesearchaeota archaeon]MBT6367719.1 MBL fold metallo-hydrolase [Candidatus Woesearchaeota archaeon]MBT7762880.1 MBL fold metallo-hydrolase [Candidatus Woesearchaeota archaeon]
MPIEVCTVGGFTKTGGNSVAVKVGDEVVILDMGLNMEKYIHYTEDREDIRSKTYKELLKADAVPDYTLIKDWTKNVVGIVPSHAHLDHIGAIPYAAPLFPDATIVCTPYTAEVLKAITHDEKLSISNKIIPMNVNSTYKLSKNFTVEFVNVTHSIPHATLIILHTPEGSVMYANDYKFDRQPTLGKKPNFERLKELGDKGISLLIMECLYAHEHRKMPSESVAKQMLKDVLLGVQSEGKGMIVTTFSSHIARLKSIIEMGKKLNRKIVFLGRSLSKYVTAAQNIELVNFEKDVKLIGYRDKIDKMLHKIMKEGKEKYLIVCTGHQGEPKAILSRLAKGHESFRFESGDIVTFSCSVIPVELNKENRGRLEQNLRNKNVRIFTDVHVSGHGAREDHRDLLELVRPKNIIPSHAGKEKAEMLKELAAQLGFKKTHIMVDGKRIVI